MEENMFPRTEVKDKWDSGKVQTEIIHLSEHRSVKKCYMPDGMKHYEAFLFNGQQAGATKDWYLGGIFMSIDLYRKGERTLETNFNSDELKDIPKHKTLFSKSLWKRICDKDW